MFRQNKPNAIHNALIIIPPEFLHNGLTISQSRADSFEHSHTDTKTQSMKKIFTQLLFLAALFSFTQLAAQTSAGISGKVKDKKTGEYLIGANIHVKGTAIRTATNAEGAFTISNVPEGDQTLLVSYMGFVEKEVPAASGTKVADITLETKSSGLGEVIVTGLRRSQLQSIAQKRAALNIKEVITANETGRLPDINIAEATQRVSGVSIETNRGEGQFVSIRGIQPSLNNVTLNNTTLASTTNSRATALDLMPTEVISSIEVIKSNTPDMEANAIGGTVNINTISAFSRSKPFFNASVDGIIQPQQVDLSGFDRTRMPFRTAFTTGKLFGKKKNFGAVVSANFFRRDFSASMLDPDGWVWDKYFYPNEIELQIEDIERDRLGLSADFEYRPTSRNSIYLKTLYTNTKEIQKNSEFELTMQIGSARPLNQTQYTGRFARGSGELDQAYTNETENLYNYTLGTRNRFGKLSTDIYGTFSKAATRLNNMDATFENPTATEPQLSLVYNTKPYFFEITPENPAYASNPDIYKLRNLNYTTGTINENVYELSGDFKYDIKLGATPAYLKFGGRYRERSKAVDRMRDAYDLSFGGVTIPHANGWALTPFYYPTTLPAQGGATPFVHGVVNKFKTFFDNPANLQDRTKLVYDTLVSQTQSIINDLNNSESVTAGYLMGVVDFARLTVIAGFRVENTTTISNNKTASTLSGKLVNGNSRATNTYTNFLPSIHLKYNLTRNTLARASWTNTIGRPDYTQLSGTTVFNYAVTANPALYKGSLSIANPDLKPYLSSNFDVSLEHYMPKGGIISVGGFYKRIDNQIYRVSDLLRNTAYDGKTFEELTRTQNRNADDARLYGVEFSYDQAFTFLPNAWNGLGLSMNFALIGSKVNLPNRPDENLPLFRQASNVYNAALYYQKKGFEFRLATSHRSAYLTEAANADSYKNALDAGIALKEFDRYDAARTTYDVSGSYMFLKNKMKLMLQVRNITNEPEAGYQGNINRYDRHDLTGRSYFMGLSLTL